MLAARVLGTRYEGAGGGVAVHRETDTRRRKMAVQKAAGGWNLNHRWDMRAITCSVARRNAPCGTARGAGEECNKHEGSRRVFGYNQRRIAHRREGQSVSSGVRSTSERTRATKGRVETVSHEKSVGSPTNKFFSFSK